MRAEVKKMLQDLQEQGFEVTQIEKRTITRPFERNRWEISYRATWDLANVPDGYLSKFSYRRVRDEINGGMMFATAELIKKGMRYCMTVHDSERADEVRAIAGRYPQVIVSNSHAPSRQNLWGDYIGDNLQLIHSRRVS